MTSVSAALIARLRRRAKLAQKQGETALAADLERAAALIEEHETKSKPPSGRPQRDRQRSDRS